MGRWLQQLLCRRFRRNTEGVAAMEFALIAPVLMLLVSGIIETAIVFYVSNVIESATMNTSRLGKTGFVAQGVSREQTLRNMLEERAGGLIDMNRVQITTQFYSTFDQVGQAEPFQDTNANGAHDDGEAFDDINGNGSWDADMGQQGLGDANDVVVYTVTYPWEIATPVIGDLLADEHGNFNITARTVVKNEPYSTN